MKQAPTEPVLQSLDRDRQRRLRNITAPRRPRKIAFLAESQEILDNVEIQGGRPIWVES